MDNVYQGEDIFRYRALKLQIIFPFFFEVMLRNHTFDSFQNFFYDRYIFRYGILSFEIIHFLKVKGYMSIHMLPWMQVRNRMTSLDGGQRYSDGWKGERWNGEDGTSWKT